jgi:hypothetical protein
MNDKEGLLLLMYLSKNFILTQSLINLLYE